MELKLDKLYEQIEQARTSYLALVSGLSNAQATFRPSEEVWSILNITEHLVWAEQIGICGMFNAVESLKRGAPIWSGVSPNAGLSIEEIVERTWQPKEKVPKVAEPRWGGSLDFWMVNLRANAIPLRELQQISHSVDLTQAIYPHPISGPMNVIQRLEFLRFHMERHQKQVEGIKLEAAYPTN